MQRRLIFPFIVGLTGAAILFSLGTWQMDRKAWKDGVIADITTMVAIAPVDLPITPTEAEHEYLSVQVTGEIGAGEIPVLASTKQVGAIYRIISPFRMDNGRMILVDQGYMLDELKDDPRPIGAATIVGNLLWPDEIDSFTPEPDLKANIWFARDIERMAEYLNTEPILVVARETSLSDTPVTPLPVDISGIPNKHLEYAVTWYGLGIVWLMMSVYMARRKPRKDES